MSLQLHAGEVDDQGQWLLGNNVGNRCFQDRSGGPINFTLDDKRSILTIETCVRTVDKTGVEMEALTAAAVAGLTVYDMVKAIDRGVVMTGLCLVEKSGGKSGVWRRKKA